MFEGSEGLNDILTPPRKDKSWRDCEDWDSTEEFFTSPIVVEENLSDHVVVNDDPPIPTKHYTVEPIPTKDFIGYVKTGDLTIAPVIIWKQHVSHGSKTWFGNFISGDFTQIKDQVHPSSSFTHFFLLILDLPTSELLPRSQHSAVSC